MIRIRSGSPQVVCGIAPITRVPTAMIRIRSGSPLVTMIFWHYADQEGTDSYVLFGEDTYV